MEANQFTSHPKLVTVGVIQGSVLIILSFPLYANDFFNDVGSRFLFLLADDIKTVYAFMPEALSPIVAGITQDLISLNTCANERMMKFSAESSFVRCYKCTFSQGGLELDVEYSPSAQWVETWVQANLVALAFHVARADKIVPLPHRILS